MTTLLRFWHASVQEPHEQPAPKAQIGLLVTQELTKAVDRCRTKVKRLAKECRDGNRRFRDIEFDLVEDRPRCLHGLDYNRESPKYDPKDVRRVADIFEEPKFFISGATASDICQGQLSDCWFLSALAVVGTVGNLIEQICVERDEEVGIYGFIFWRDSGWVDVIIDDLLFTSVPPWERLTVSEKLLHHNDKARYQKHARKGGSNLYFAKSKEENETWVPLIEKAYAKLHGDYNSLDGGFTSEGVEDLTGGVSTLIFIQDILNKDVFWKTELSHVGNDRLFACFTSDSSVGTEQGYQSEGVPVLSAADNGLVVNHAYSVIKAIEFEDPETKKTRRFLRVRNPWGKTEWNGRWSDGSGEWNPEWTSGLKLALGNYKFGNDGEFIMEYDDFLENWGIIERSRLFDSSWHMSSQWLKVPVGDDDHSWGHGDVSFTIDVPEDTDAVIVLAQLDKRYFRELSGRYEWSLDFTLYPMSGGRVPAAGRSVHSALWERSVKMEVHLNKGQYVVQVRLDRRTVHPKDYLVEKKARWDDRAFARKHTKLLYSQAIAANFDAKAVPPSLPIPSKVFKGRSITELEITWAAKSRPSSDQASIVVTQSPTGDAPPTASSTTGFEVPGTPSTLSGRMRHPMRFDTRSSTTSTSTTNSDPGPGDLSRVQTPVREEPDESDAGSSIFTGASLLLGNSAFALRDQTPMPSSRPLASAPSDNDYITSGSEGVSRGRAWVPAPLQVPSGPTPATRDPSAHGASKEDDGIHKHAGFTCSNCSHVPRGVMHYCTHITCLEYILCDPCMRRIRSLHEQGHKFIQSYNKEDDNAIKSCHGKNGDCWDDLVLGLRVYTKNPKTEVEGQLRTGSMLRKSLFNPPRVA